MDEKKKKKIEDWISWKWPTEFLLHNEEDAELLANNAFFAAINFYSHEWKWKDKELYMLLKEKIDGKEIIDYKPWSYIKKKFKLVKAATWTCITNYLYTKDGLQEKLAYEWNVLEPIYTFPKDIGYSFIDIISSNWLEIFIKK